MENLDFLSNVTNSLWGNYGFQILFYFSLVLILILEKKKQQKILWFWYPVCILMTIYNPIMYAVCRYIFGSRTNLTAYYCRLFCLIPIVFVIAYAVVLLLEQTSGWKKMGCTFLLLAAISFCGHSVYEESWFVKASNVNKVPTDVLQLCNIFQGQDVSIMVPTEFVVYMRQMYSGFHMPYGRGHNSEISNQLQSETPDVASILNYAANTETYYVVALYNEESLAEYLSWGCEVTGYTDRYVVLHYTLQ